MNPLPEQSRREFIKSSSAAVIGGALASNLIFPQKSFAQNSETIKIGLVGCGGRGSGAAKNALMADKNVVLVAMGDVFKDRLDTSHANLTADREVGNRVQVPQENRYSGFDAYKKVIDSGVDVVLLCAPPAFRPAHAKYAAEKNKHMFCEKPVCTDAPGYRSFMETVAETKRKKLALVAGFCWRFNHAERAIYDKVLGGEIGEVRSIYGTYNTGPARQVLTNPAWGPMEVQLRNWINLLWLSGDHLVEQAIHNVDLTNWAMNNKMPVKCVAHGGRQVRPEGMFGNIYDHFSVVYEWDNGVRGFLFCRQQPGCFNENVERIYGSNGTAHVMLFNGVPYTTNLKNERVWRYPGEKNTPNMYEVEHQEMFASIRQGSPRNDGEWLANSSMMGIMGRMAAYTGEEISWEMAVNSQEKLVPDEADLNWDKAPAITPIPVPGQTKFI